MTPSYDQLLSEIKKSGVYFSDYDLQYAKENPAAGYGILQAKIDYGNATTPEAKALANAAAEEWRRQGNYTAGVEGSGYNPILPASTGNTRLDAKTNLYMDYPSYSYDAPAPSFDASAYTAPTFDATKYKAPTFDDSYKQTYDAQLDKMLNYEDFKYDPKSDQRYAAYKQAYTREGQRATADALGQAAALTGGIPSSYATAAAAQAGNYYAAQLADKIPELYQQAYNEYADQYNRLSNNANAAMNARSFDLNTYQTNLNQFNNDRNFDFSNYQTQLNQFNNDRNFDFGAYQTELNQYNNDRAFDYGLYNDEFNRIGNQIGVLTDQDNTAYAREQALLKAAGRGGGSRTAEAVDTTPIPSALWVQLNSGTAEDAAEGLITYWDRLSESQRSILARKAGLSADMVRGGIGNTAEDAAAILALSGLMPETGSAETVAPDKLSGEIVSSVKDVKTAIDFLEKRGIENAESKFYDFNTFKNTKGGIADKVRYDENGNKVPESTAYIDYLQYMVYKALR